MVLFTPNGEYKVFEGVCEGSIALRPMGENGFGYDPIFQLEEDTKTMAELSSEEKNSISHRGKALKKVIDELQKYS